MKRSNKFKTMSKLICMVLIVAMALCVSACGSKDVAEYSTVVIENGKTYGSGAKEFTYKVVDPDGNESTATVKTDKTMVGEALSELNLIAGETNQYGLYIKSVNNITLDWDRDAMYWGFYIDGEYAISSVDLTEIVSGSEYTLKAEK